MLLASTDLIVDQVLNAGDKPITLGILAYIVYLLYQANKTLASSDKKHTLAIKWLKLNLQNLHVRVENLERFNERVHPNDWRSPTVERSITPIQTINDDEDF